MAAKSLLAACTHRTKIAPTRRRPSQTYDNKTSLAATARAADEDGEAEAQKAAKARTTDEDWAETYNFMALDLGYEVGRTNRTAHLPPVPQPAFFLCSTASTWYGTL